MKNGIKTVAIGLLLFLGVPYLVESVITREQLRTVETRASDPNSEPVLDAAYARSEFLRGCDDGSLDGARFDQTTYCGCMYDKLEARYGVNGIIDMGLNKTDAEMRAVMTPVAERCIAAQDVESI